MTNQIVNLVITIDTEEDNWGIHRSGVTVRNIFEVPRLQRLFDRYTIRPTYLVAYQIAKSPKAATLLRQIQSAGKCEIGMHLHPWNTEPVVENLNSESSMLGNLPIDLQKAKLKTSIEHHLRAFDSMPTTFRAGRWGLTKATMNILGDAGFKVDSSLTPLTSWEDEGLGQVFRYSDTEPCWILSESESDTDKLILEVPVSIGYNRWPPRFWHEVSNHLKKSIYRPLRIVGLLHHMKLLRKIWLSPEICSAHDMIKLAKLMMEKGKTLLNFTFHTPSLLAGCGPFVKDARDLENFYHRIEKFLRFANENPRIQSVTLSEVLERSSENKGKSCELLIQ